jgi:AcrR family transcriptional regulator
VAAVSTALRSDARQNHATLLAATSELFAEQGVDVPAREIAARAGVGVGTLYRHFPTRDELVDAVLADAFEAYVAAAERALDAEDGWAGFAGYLETARAISIENRALLTVGHEHDAGRERIEALRRRLRPLTRRLIERAQAEGALRADFRVDDVRLALAAGASLEPAERRRHLRFLLDGLRAR